MVQEEKLILDTISTIQWVDLGSSTMQLQERTRRDCYIAHSSIPPPWAVRMLIGKIHI
jgi:hypothetical protein